MLLLVRWIDWCLLLMDLRLHLIWSWHWGLRIKHWPFMKYAFLIEIQYWNMTWKFLQNILYCLVSAVIKLGPCEATIFFFMYFNSIVHRYLRYTWFLTIVSSKPEPWSESRCSQVLTVWISMCGVINVKYAIIFCFRIILCLLKNMNVLGLANLLLC